MKHSTYYSILHVDEHNHFLYAPPPPKKYLHIFPIESIIHDYLQGWRSQKDHHRPSKRSPRSTSRTRTWWWSVAVTRLPNRPWPGTRTPRSWCRVPATRCAPLRKGTTTPSTWIFWWVRKSFAINYHYHMVEISYLVLARIY